ncbi:ubiquitin carboxyl-terminal hydrolase [Elysia marginata]|uniref:Ubiquitin carboxyl-terminal hydrolase n=1 Tax=Elysia marginata TaxID=1093978 RepID=A0AAV4JGL8_9GAST|nr:ubiquitin carboxyl-terminal hydrolase [Elysia marginata]
MQDVPGHLFPKHEVVSPTSSEKSDSEGTASVKEPKKSVTFSADITGAPGKCASDSECMSVSSSSETATTCSAVSTLPIQPSSILKGSSSSTSTASATPGPVLLTSSTVTSAVSCAISTAVSVCPSLSTQETACLDSSTHLISSLSLPNTSEATSTSVTSTSTTECKSASSNSPKEELIAGEASEMKADPGIKEEPMDTTTETQCAKPTTSTANKPDKPPVIKIEDESKTSESKVILQASSVSGTLRADITKPLSIETKFSSSPCAASNESTDTASEIGSGFSSPGSLNTSSSQSSPQFSDSNTGANEGSEERHRRKRRSSHAFTPKDLLYLLKNVENEIELCESNLKEENEKRKKYKIDACRRTHNYDQFIMTFLSMLAEQGLLGELMEENMAIKKPGGTGAAGGNNSSAGSKIAKKAQFSVGAKKKKSAKIKKKGKR